MRVEAVERADTPRVQAGEEESRVERWTAQAHCGVQAGGEDCGGDVVICALPHERAECPLEPLLGQEAERWRGLGASPIVNVHIVYNRRVCDLQFAAGVGTPVQYLFDRSEAAGLIVQGRAVMDSIWRYRCLAP